MSWQPLMNSQLLNYDHWTSQLDQNSVMASAAELHGLIAGMLSAGVPADSATILPVLYDFLNDGQALNTQLKAAIEQLIAETATQLADEDYSMQLLVPGDDDAMAERLEALVEWAQAFLVGFAIQQTDLSLVSADVRDAIEQLSEITRIDIYTEDDSSETENEESYYLVLEHVRLMVLTCFNEVGQKFTISEVASKTLH
jgi:yecA family protein